MIYTFSPAFKEMIDFEAYVNGLRMADADGVERSIGEICMLIDGSEVAPEVMATVGGEELNPVKECVNESCPKVRISLIS